jgi:hypothetical protein
MTARKARATAMQQQEQQQILRCAQDDKSSGNVGKKSKSKVRGNSRFPKEMIVRKPRAGAKAPLQ